MMNYDPNMFCCGRMTNQIVRIVFGSWKYRKTIETVVSGNCQGLDVIEAAIENIYDDLTENIDNEPEIILVNSAGDTLNCADNEGIGLEWLKSMLISTEIIDVKSTVE